MVTNPMGLFKKKQKKLSARIRGVRNLRKVLGDGASYTNLGEGFVGTLQGFECTLSNQYRVRHLAYCMARGRTMEQIEPKTGQSKSLLAVDLKHIAVLRDVLTTKLTAYHALKIREYEDMCRVSKMESRPGGSSVSLDGG